MRKRSHGLERIAKVERARRSLAEWRLADLSRSAEKTGAMRRAVLESLNADAPLHGHFVDTMARHLARLDAAATDVAAAIDQETARFAEASRRLRQAERLRRAATRSEERDADRAALLDCLDLSADASLP